MNYRYYNPNPITSTSGDCVVRMLCAITGRPWVDVYLSLAEKGIEMGDMMSANRVWMAYLKDLGYKRHVIPNSCPDCYTINDFCNDNPVGTYVVGTGSHVVCIRNGSFLDTWNSGEEPIFFYFSR